MDILEVSRRSFTADAVAVTVENLYEVAAWCGGSVASTRLIEPGDCQFIELVVDRGPRQKMIRAFPGQWITKNGERFTVYKNAVFRGTFDLPGAKKKAANAVTKTVKREDVLALVERAMGEDYVSSYWGEKHDVSNDVTDAILALIN